MVTCPICERQFDEREYQVCVVGLGSFDSIACLEATLRRRARESRKAALDPAYVEHVEPSGTDHTT